MYDIKKFIDDDRLSAQDPEGHFSGLEHWSPRIAIKLAEAEGIELDEEHWRVIYCLREWFRERGPEWTAREVTRRLDRDFAEEGGRRHLYQLFPHGPVMQGCRIAGVPAPTGTLSLSFGSAH